MDEREAFLENYDQFFQQLGQGKTSGKILGQLMIGEDPEMTLDQLAIEIGRSKSTVHTAIKGLINLGIVEERIEDSVPSEGRYPHFYSFKKNFFEYSLQQFSRIAVFKKLILDAITFLEHDNIRDGRIVAFEETYALYSWFEEKLKENFDEWRDLKSSGEYKKYLDYKSD